MLRLIIVSLLVAVASASNEEGKAFLATKKSEPDVVRVQKLLEENG